MDAHQVYRAGEIISQNVQGHFGSDARQVFIRKCVAPIRALIVPNGCSTVSRRVRMAWGFSSNRFCTASMRCSCSHRVIRRSLPVVHLCLSVHYHAIMEDGTDTAAINVFTRRDGTIRHFWGAETGSVPPDPGEDPTTAPDLMPLWNVLDLTPEGRGADWYPKITYY